jgi:transposase-like protein
VRRRRAHARWRPRKLTPHQRREAIARREAGDETLTDIARSYNVSHSTISRQR